MRAVLLGLSGLLACHPEEPDRGPVPWQDAPGIPLQVFAPHAQQNLPGTKLARIQSAQLTLVLDDTQVRVLDARYHHNPGPTCVNPELWAADPDNRQGSCGAGKVELKRGSLSPGTKIAGMAVAGDIGYVLDENGALWLASGDQEIANPYDYLRLQRQGNLGVAGLLAISPAQEIAVATPTELVVFSTEGVETRRVSVPGTVQALGWDSGGLRVLTDLGLWWEEEWYERPGSALAWEGDLSLVAGQDGLWAIWAGQEPVLWTPEPMVAVGIAPGTRKVVGATAAELVAWDETGTERGRTALGGVLDVLVTPSAEVVALTDQGTQVFLDELALLDDRPPLQTAITAFFERPRKEADDVSCSGDESVRAFVDRAVGQSHFLSDLPFPIALGVTSWGAKRIAECGETDTFASLASAHTVGVLFHEAPEECVGDSTCYEEFLQLERDYVAKLGSPVRWMTGTAPHEDIGLDWVAMLQTLGGPLCLLFPGMAFLPAIDHNTDPRAKDPWPWRLEDLGQTSTLDHADQFGQNPGGALTVFPGDNVPVFSLSGCPNLFLWECYTSGGGGGKSITPEDTEVLTLLLHRAIAMRGTHAAWTFHLPDLGIYDYTEGCTEENRLWSGEDCSAGVLQTWAIERWQKYIPAGIVEASVP